MGEAEVGKLLRHATEWLPQHPIKEWIIQQYLKHRRSLAREVLAQLMREEESDAGAGDTAAYPWGRSVRRRSSSPSR